VNDYKRILKNRRPAVAATVALGFRISGAEMEQRNQLGN